VRVLLVSMPFGALDRPSLALGLLSAGLNEAGICCDTAYLSLAFARDLGVEAYERVAGEVTTLAMAPDWTFAECLFGAKWKPSDDYVDEVLRATWRTDRDGIDAVLAAKSLASGFLSWATRELAWSDYDVVGFTCSCGQTIPSLALASRLKQRHKSLVLVFGGPAWHGSMGCALFTSFPFVDAACIGEGDAAFPSFVTALAAGHDLATGAIAGMLTRGTCSDCMHEVEPVSDLDDLPLPDYADYARAVADAGALRKAGIVIPVESSRGCWWAAKKPCAFCGINGPQRTFRAKSARRILHELQTFAQHPGCRLLEIVDNIASPQLLSAVLPQLAEHPLPVPLFLEVRPDVSRRTVELLSQVGASTQAGVESFSDRVLRLMNKGTSSLENVRFLKWCKALGVPAHWNLLYGFPGESPEDYEETISVLDAVRFLGPPDACGAVKLERFSPYFDDPASHGFINVRPAAAYSYLFPFEENTLADIAYFFDYDYRIGFERPLESFRLVGYANAWRREASAGELRTADAGGSLIDSRLPGTARTFALEGLERLLYEACDDLRSRSELHELAHHAGADGEGTEQQVDAALSSFVERGLMMTRDDLFLSLALPEPMRHPPP
jgi:ribosomal peptide maturation radical SAM protein 1